MFFDMVISLFGLLRSKHSSRIITTGDNHLRIGIISCYYYCKKDVLFWGFRIWFALPSI